MPDSILGPLKETLFSGYITMGPRVKEFEKEFGQWIGNNRVSMVNSCTSALTLALYQSGVQKGTNVVSTPMTCVATNTPIKNLQADIRFADVHADNGNIDASTIEEQITDDTKAIMVVHWAGVPCDLNAVHAVAKKHGLPVIEDAAHTLGGFYDGKKIGNHSDFVCFSFQAIKHINTIDGGALFCKNEEEYQRSKRLRWFGLDRDEERNAIVGYKTMKEPGFKMNMSDVSAAMGLEQLKYLDEIVSKHKSNAKILRQELSGVVDCMAVPPKADPAYWIFTILVNSEKRKEIARKLDEAGIDANTSHMRNDIYEPLSTPLDYPGLNSFSSRMLNIPCGWWVNPDELNHVIKSIKEAVK